MGQEGEEETRWSDGDTAQTDAVRRISDRGNNGACLEYQPFYRDRCLWTCTQYGLAPSSQLFSLRHLPSNQHDALKTVFTPYSVFSAQNFYLCDLLAGTHSQSQAQVQTPPSSTYFYDLSALQYVSSVHHIASDLTTFVHGDASLHLPSSEFVKAADFRDGLLPHVACSVSWTGEETFGDLTWSGTHTYTVAQRPSETLRCE